MTQGRIYQLIFVIIALKFCWLGVYLTPKKYVKKATILNYSCYARSILSCHIFKLLPSNLVRSKNQFVLNSKVI
ncbi:hypothetical protein [Legionella sp. km772]|uniref:hypothetical protein n=1 Tax=Legionella sp. km772 TaxID=2498111 RepID=UPI0013151E30|nr:hypothetical protein [Legionella sp. km772]